MKNLLLLFCLILFSSKNIYSSCPGMTITVTMFADGPNLGDAAVLFTPSGNVGAVRVLWDLFANQNQNIYTYVLSSPYLTGGPHWAVVNDIATNCFDTIYFNVYDNFCPINSLSIIEKDSCLFNDLSLKVYLDTNVNPTSNSYQYNWSNGATTSTLTGVASGTYTVTVTLPSSNCFNRTANITVTDDTCVACSKIKLSIQENDPCSTFDVSLIPTVYNGSTKYTYEWNTGSFNKNLTNISSGTYSLTVTDSFNNCTIDTTYVVIDNTCNLCDSIKVSFKEVDSCSLSDATLIPTISNTSGNYSTFWSTGVSTDTLFNLKTGMYRLIIYDNSYLCSKTDSIFVSDTVCGACVNFNLNTQELDSCGFYDVKIKANVINGSGNYTYLWNTGDTSNLTYYYTSGNFDVSVKDVVTGCRAFGSISIIDDTCNMCDSFFAKVYEIDSCRLNDVSLNAIVHKGSGNYSYLWNTGAISSSLKNLTTGTYSVTITDLTYNCVKDTTLSVLDDTCVICNTNNPSLVYFDSCQANDVIIKINNLSNSFSYNYKWNTGATTNSLSGVAAGSYNVTITSSNGCIYNLSITVKDTNFKCCKAIFIVSNDSINTKQFTSNSISYKSQITSYSWAYGDNTTGNGSPVSHTYLNPGTYLVCHHIETGIGCKDTVCHSTLAPTPGKNLKISHYGSPYKKDTTKYTYLEVKNIGTTIEFPTVEYNYPIGCSLSYSFPSITSNVGNKITYNIGQLNPGQSKTIYILINVPSTFTIGSLKNDTSKILPYFNDIDTTNNIAKRTDSVVSSWDPNEKLASPQGVGVEGNVPLETKEINYFIHFQNEGNYRTFTVRVEDEIDSNLDISTLSLGDVSHPVRMVVNGSKIVWYFDNIELTPKAQNEAKSQGYIAYSMKLKKGLPIGTKIKNTAYIYFDKNPAIITNTTVHTLKVDAVTNGIQSLILGSNQIQINRNQNNLILSSDKLIKNVEVYNLSGQKITEQILNSKKVDFEIANWPSGIYIFDVNINNEVHQLKIKL